MTAPAPIDLADLSYACAAAFGLIFMDAQYLDCDLTVNLYDFYHVVRGETLIDLWPVSARGRAR